MRGVINSGHERKLAFVIRVSTTRGMSASFLPGVQRLLP